MATTKKNSRAGGAQRAVKRPAANRKPAKKIAVARHPPPKKATPTRERLTAVKPSGGKDDSFFDLVHDVARQIPRGRVTSYGAIAACLGTRLSARMVGWAMMAVPYAKKPVPAHRVVNRNGLLTGKHHYSPPDRMQQLLEKEGVVVKDDKVVDFKKLFWDPATEL
jgi:methylated-DNA-protein-cysteine methyltransferase related protein